MADVSMALTLANVEGEYVEQTIKSTLLVIDIVREESSAALDGYPREPVKFHGIKDFTDWLEISHGTIKGAHHFVCFIIKLIALNTEEVSHSLNEIIKGLFLIVLSMLHGVLDIFNLLNEHIVLVDEGSLSNSLMVFQGVRQARDSLGHLKKDFFFSFCLDLVESSLQVRDQGGVAGIKISRFS